MTNEAGLEFGKMQLLPCPFCGGDAIHLHTKVKSSHDPNILLDFDRVDCSACRSSSRSYCDDRNAAIKAWNTRATVQPTDADRKAALEALDRMASMILNDKDNVIKTNEENIIRAALQTPPAVTDEQRKAALEWHEQSVGDPKYLDSMDRKHYETIRAALQTPRVPVVKGLEIAIREYDEDGVIDRHNIDQIVEAARWVAEQNKKGK